MEEPVALLAPVTAGAGPESIEGLPSPRRRRIPTPLAVLLWCTVGFLATVAVMRIVAWDSFQPFAVLDDVTLFVYLPTWIIAGVAAVGRRWVLCAASLLVVAAQVAFLAPELTAATPVPGWAANAPTLSLLDANVYNDNPSMAGYSTLIDQLRPQLVTLEEVTPPGFDELDSSGALAQLPFRLQIRQFDPWSFLIASRYPVTGGRAVYAYDRALILQATLSLPSGPIDLWVVHTVAPLPNTFSQWQDQLDLINRAVRRHGTNRLLVVGDFNATWGSRGFRQILDAGLADGAAVRGQPFAMTWSQDFPVLPPLVRIDHVLTGTGLTVTRFATRTGPGSDHRAMVATIAVDGRPPGRGRGR